MEPIQQLYRWQSQVDKASPKRFAADLDVAKRLLKHGIECLEENAKLREQLGDQKENFAGLRIVLEETQRELNDWKQRAEAAEAKAASEQEPVAECYDNGTPEGGLRWIPYKEISIEINAGTKFYASPVPPVDVQELQINNALYESEAERIWSLMPELRNTESKYELHEAVQELQREMCKWVERFKGEHSLVMLAKERIAELERKLRQWERPYDQAAFDSIKRQASHKDSLCAQSVYITALEVRVKELNTLLAQAREEGRKEAMHDTKYQTWEANRAYAVHEIYGAHKPDSEVKP